ncbi:hypothetical protein [Pseudomonas rossensis]|uniref:hypothetical protein n=1 Tax=Pseudomonas rossensis TaxID=2305471 RepID=UPI00325FF263
MITFEYSPTPKLIELFTKEVIDRASLAMTAYLPMVPTLDRQKFEDLFNSAAIKNLLLCSPELLTAHIHQIYTALPILADRYCPAYLLAGIQIPSNISKLNLRKRHDTIAIDVAVQNALEFLNHKATPDLSFTLSLLKLLSDSKLYGEKKKALGRIYNVAYGDFLLTKEDLKIFPLWIENFSKVFNYSDLSKKIGLAIVQELNINICLYCNNENIQTRGLKVKLRADLDHFYPKTKFPFLAVALSNLVPSGSFCNQGYKKNYHMLDFEHPFIAGVTTAKLFHVEIPPGEKPTKANLKVRVIAQGSKIDRSIEKFEIENLYSTQDDINSWIRKAHEVVDFTSGFNNSETTDILLGLLVDASKPPHQEQAKKFKVDSINQFANRQILSYP